MDKETIDKSPKLIDTTVHDKKREKAEKLRNREISDIKKILSLVEGRRFMWRLLSETGVYRSSFTGNSTTFFNEGSRNVGLWVLSDLLKANPTAFNQMQNENKSEIKSYEEKRI